MRRSLNEVHSIIAKACVACGYPAGIAGDIAAAAIVLSAHGGDGLAAALSSIRGGMPPPQAPQFNGDRLIFADSNAAAIGMAAAEIVLTSGGCASFNRVDAPLLLCGLVAVAAKNYSAAYRLSFADNDGGECALLIPAAEHLLPPAIPPIQANSSAQLRLVRAAATAPAAPLPDGIKISCDQWRQAEALAVQTYVTVTEHSRTDDAGAGAIDND